MALQLGKVNVKSMLRRITYEQLLEWRAFSELEPFGELRMDYRFASIVQTLAEINRDTKKRGSPFKLEECVVKFGDEGERTAKSEPVRRQPWQEQKAFAKIIAAAFNKRGVAA